MQGEALVMGYDEMGYVSFLLLNFGIKMKPTKSLYHHTSMSTCQSKQNKNGMGTSLIVSKVEVYEAKC